MATTTRPKRAISTRSTVRTTKKDDTDELAQKLKTNLKISEPTTKPRRPAAPQTSSRSKIPKPVIVDAPRSTTASREKEVKDAMGVVNTVLQHLSTAIGCKWTASSAKKNGDTEAMATTTALAGSARTALATIRRGGGNSMGAARADVEKAAASMLGKLVQTEMASPSPTLSYW
jgi:outer membrane biosynthesis protein TonB